MKEFIKFTKVELSIISFLLVLLSVFGGYYFGTQYNFETKAITKTYS